MKNLMWLRSLLRKTARQDVIAGCIIHKRGHKILHQSRWTPTQLSRVFTDITKSPKQDSVTVWGTASCTFASFHNVQIVLKIVYQIYCKAMAFVFPVICTHEVVVTSSPDQMFGDQTPSNTVWWPNRVEVRGQTVKTCLNKHRSVVSVYYK